MLYVMKNELFSWGDDFIILDQTGTERFFVDGKAFSLGDNLSFQDMLGNELVHINERLLSWGHTYDIYRKDELVTLVRKDLFTFFHCKFTVDVEGVEDIEAEGDFLDHEYSYWPCFA